MSKVLIIGAGGVGQVVAHKCAQLPEVFSEITLASRTESKCKKIAAQIKRQIRTAQVDADNVPQMVQLIKRVKPKLVINVALPYQDLHIMDACLETGVDYLDTANYEPLDKAKFEYKWQWAYQDRFKKAGLMALLGSRLRPGRDQRLHRLAAQARVRRDRDARHRRRQRRQPRPALRDQFQSRDQHPGNHAARAVIGKTIPGKKPTRFPSSAASTSRRASAR